MTILISARWDKVIAAAAAILALAAAGCVTASGSSGVPDWLAEYPADPSYYVGIGGSDTGSIADDRNAAAASARADLAAQISAYVASELDISTSASSDGSFEESVKSSVSESVEGNLKSVETVDTWFSPDRGVWVYVRLSKDTWSAIIEAEIADLATRARGILKPVADGGMTLSAEAAALGRAREVLRSSPWGLSIRDEILGGSGFLVDSVDAAISERMGTLSIRIDAASPRIPYGTQAVLTGTVSSGTAREIGALPLVISGTAGMNASIATEPNGSFSVTLPTQNLSPGVVRFEISPDLSAWDIPTAGFPVSRGAVELAVEPVLLALDVDSSAAADLADFDGAVGDWISGLGLPVRTVSPGRGEVALTFSWTVFDFPRSERFANAPHMAEVGAVLTVSRGGEVVFTRNLDSVKDGGLDYDQAHERSARTFLDDLAGDGVLAADLTEALGL